MEWLQSESNRGCPICRVRSDIVPLDPGDKDYYFSLINKGCYSCTARCEQGGFVEKDVLSEAADHGVSAIKYDRSRPEACVMIAYLFFLVGLSCASLNVTMLRDRQVSVELPASGSQNPAPGHPSQKHGFAMPREERADTKVSFVRFEMRK